MSRKILTDDLPEPPWQLFAKCRGLPAGWFVPSQPGGSLTRVVAICNGDGTVPPCPVKAECKAAGEANDEIGVWGGEIRSTKRKHTSVASSKARVIRPVEIIQDARPKRSGPAG